MNRDFCVDSSCMDFVSLMQKLLLKLFICDLQSIKILLIIKQNKSAYHCQVP